MADERFCKACNKYYLLNKEFWYFGPNNIRINCRACMQKSDNKRYQLHGDKIRARNNSYREKNKKERRLQNLCWQKENKEKHNISSQKWKAKNKDLVRSYTRKRRALKRGKYIPYTSKQLNSYLNIFECSIIKGVYYGKCFYCKLKGGDGLFEHIDHAISLSQGGTDWLINLIPSCAYHNCSKGAKSFKEFVSGKNE